MSPKVCSTGAIPASLIFWLFAMNSSQVVGTSRPSLLVGGDVVEDSAAGGGSPGRAKDIALRGDDLLERLVQVGDPGLVGDGRQVCRRGDRLEQGSGVVLEHLSHVAGRQPGLDQVVAVGTTRAGVQLDLDVRVGRLERLDDGLGRLDVVGSLLVRNVISVAPLSPPSPPSSPTRRPTGPASPRAGRRRPERRRVRYETPYEPPVSGTAGAISERPITFQNP